MDVLKGPWIVYHSATFCHNQEQTGETTMSAPIPAPHRTNNAFENIVQSAIEVHEQAAQLKEENLRLNEENARLQEENTRMQVRISELEKGNAQLNEENARLLKDLVEKQQLARSATVHNATLPHGTSTIPPAEKVKLTEGGKKLKKNPAFRDVDRPTLNAIAEAVADANAAVEGD